MIHIRSLIQRNTDSATDIYNTKYSENRWKHGCELEFQSPEDILDFDEDCGAQIEIPDCNDMNRVFLKVTPQEGYYACKE